LEALQSWLEALQQSLPLEPAVLQRAAVAWELEKLRRVAELWTAELAAWA
jgi:hypothetical protein